MIWTNQFTLIILIFQMILILKSSIVISKQIKIFILVVGLKLNRAIEIIRASCIVILDKLIVAC
jgi:hypothetical protein